MQIEKQYGVRTYRHNSLRGFAQNRAILERREGFARDTVE
jgi:hypothetical protein